MANKKNHRRFGNVRQRASGRWQARYAGPDGIERTAPTTFETERQAEKWLTVVESEIIRGTWTAPEAGEVKLYDYGLKWIAERRLEPRTRLAHVKADSEALVFTGEKGGLLRCGTFMRAVKWAASVKAAGIPSGFHFHDLPHTGNTLAAASGASTRELMHRMGTPACGRR